MKKSQFYTMSAFSPQADDSKPTDRLEFATQGKAAALLGLTARTIRRYLRDPQIREILGAVYDRERWRIPRSALAPPWRVAEMKERLTEIGKGHDDSVRARWRHETGLRKARIKREMAILQLALDIERVRPRARLTKKAKCKQEQLLFETSAIASKYRCSVFAARKFYEHFLTVQNNKDRQHNAPQIKWLKRQGLWSSVNPDYSTWLKRQGLWLSAKALIDSGEDYTEDKDKDGRPRRMFLTKGSGYFEAVIGYQGEDGRSHNFIFPNSLIEEGKDLKGVFVERRLIDLSPVKTKAQIARRVGEFRKRWPSSKSIEAATFRYNKTWRLFDLERAAKECRRQRKRPTVENLRKCMCRDEVAQAQGRGGISRSSYFRRRYTKAERARACRLKVSELPIAN